MKNNSFGKKRKEKGNNSKGGRKEGRKEGRKSHMQELAVTSVLQLYRM